MSVKLKKMNNDKKNKKELIWAIAYVGALEICKVLIWGVLVLDTILHTFPVGYTFPGGNEPFSKGWFSSLMFVCIYVWLINTWQEIVMWGEGLADPFN